MTTDDIRVAVFNEGGPEFDAVFFWDGKPIEYKAAKPGQKSPGRVVPYAIAYEHWAVEVNENGQLVRSTETKPNEKESQFERRLGGICPKVFLPQKDYEGNIMRDAQGRTLGNYANDPKWVDWFTNKVRFKLKRIPMSMTIEEFERA